MVNICFLFYFYWNGMNPSLSVLTQTLRKLTYHLLFLYLIYWFFSVQNLSVTFYFSQGWSPYIPHALIPSSPVSGLLPSLRGSRPSGQHVREVWGRMEEENAVLSAADPHNISDALGHEKSVLSHLPFCHFLDVVFQDPSLSAGPRSYSASPQDSWSQLNVKRQSVQLNFSGRRLLNPRSFWWTTM